MSSKQPVRIQRTIRTNELTGLKDEHQFGSFNCVTRSIWTNRSRVTKPYKTPCGCLSFLCYFWTDYRRVIYIILFFCWYRWQGICFVSLTGYWTFPSKSCTAVTRRTGQSVHSAITPLPPIDQNHIFSLNARERRLRTLDRIAFLDLYNRLKFASSALQTRDTARIA